MNEYDLQDNHSLRGKVFHTIREDILTGKYKQYEELKENTIAQELGVSRTPVREALRQLELEGLVSIGAHKRACVTGFTAKDIHDIYVARSVLEGLCAQWAAEHITPGRIREMEENIELSKFYIEKKNYTQVCELDTKFHEILYQASESRILDQLLSNFHHYVERVRKVSLATEGRAEKSNEEHHMIVEAIKAGDLEQAKELANLHVMNTFQNIDAYGVENLLRVSETQGN